MAKSSPKTTKKIVTGVSVADLSRDFNLDRNTIKTRLRGVKPVGFNARGGSLYDRALVEDLLTNADEENAETAELKNAKLREEIEKIRLLNEKNSSRLVEISEVRAGLYEVIKLEYQRLAVELPRAIAPELARLKDPAKIAARLRDEIQKVFDEVGQHEFWGDETEREEVKA